MTSRSRYVYLLSLLVLIATYSCRKEKVITDSSAKLLLSIDTLTFDTVFTTLGSTTGFFKIYNPHKQSINISSVRLVGGTSSQFRINIDGIPGVVASDIEILSKDSLYVFIEVTVDPTSNQTPFVITDEIIFITNQNQQNVTLIAWGQDANFFKDHIVLSDTTWTNDKPYVIVNFVFVDSNYTLTIEEGVRLHFWQSSSLIVRGTIDIRGTKDSVVTLQGTRLESFYTNRPSQWFGIILVRGSINNKINYSVIKNSVYGIHVGFFRDDQNTVISNLNMPDLTLTNSIIRNSGVAGIFGFFGNITAENCLIHNSGSHDVQIELGGIYQFTHCTLVNYPSSNLSHEEPILRMGDFVEVSKGVFEVAPLDATFTNTIIYGQGVNDTIEIDIETIGDSVAYLFENCLVKTEMNTNNPNFISIIKNQDPFFIDIGKEDYHLGPVSPCISTAKVVPSITTDLDGNMRDGTPDIGAFEYVQ